MQIIEKLKRIAKNLKDKEKIREGFVVILKRHEQFILDLNREQMMAGLDADGQPLGEYQSEEYAIMKLAYNPAGVVDLRLTGSFHNEMFITDEGGIWSTDSKTEKLVELYGNIFGLTEASKAKLAAHKPFIKDCENFYKELMEL